MKQKVYYDVIQSFHFLLTFLIATNVFGQNAIDLQSNSFVWSATEWKIPIVALNSRQLATSELKVPHANGETILFKLESFDFWSGMVNKEFEDDYTFFKGSNSNGDILYGYRNGSNMFISYYYNSSYFIIRSSSDQTNLFVRSTSSLDEGSADIQCLNESLETELSIRTGGKSLPCQEKSFSQLSLSLLIATTGEWSEYFKSDQEVKRSVINHVTALNVLYTKELNIQFNLILSEDLWYGSPESDPFDPGSSNLVQQASKLFDQQSHYKFDIGHILHKLPAKGLRAQGLAYIGAACKDGLKGGGWTSSQTPDQVAFNLHVLGHEIAHSLGAHHTYYATTELCETIVPTLGHGFEPGLGKSLMRYRSMCDDNGEENQELNDLYLHSHSLNEIIKHLNFYRNCGQRNPRTEKVPIEVAYDFYVPLHTAFDLKAFGSSEFEYNWEQYDTGDEWPSKAAADPILAGHFENSPMYSSQAPNSLGHKKSFPSQSVQLSQKEVEGDVYAVTPRQITMRLTTRAIDNTQCQEVVVRVIDQPALAITSPQPGDSIVLVGQSKNSYYLDPIEVQWNASSINNVYLPYDKVNIYLSVDGGMTFPYLVGDNIPNIGKAQIKLPYLNTSTARLKVAVSDERELHEIYVISDGNFSIQGKIRELKEIDFTTRIEKNSPVLNWDIPILKQNIENVRLSYSNDGKQFTTLAENLPKQFTFLLARDHMKNLEGSAIFYQLAVEDSVGVSFYSKTVTVELPQTDIEIRPNPSDGGQIKVILSEDDWENRWLEVYSIRGQLIWQTAVSGTEVVLPELFIPGLYFIAYRYGQETKIKKFVVQ